MAEFTNPPVIDQNDPPVAGDAVVWDGTKWVTQAITSAAVTVPQAHIAATGAPAAVTSSQEATADANAAGVGYLQADQATIVALVNDLKVKYNAAQVDIAALRATLAAFVTAHNTLLTELQTAGVLSAS